ncbi:MAG: hypothetical protein J6M05_02645 [Cardiobacteriaceae bacterium]|nr:hypothetical protein [Cardiobacteriaceae bacterium]
MAKIKKIVVVKIIRIWRFLRLTSFNNDQIEGVARICDTLTASAIIGFIVGTTRHGHLNKAELFYLFLLFLVLFYFSLLLRRYKNDIRINSCCANDGNNYWIYYFHSQLRRKNRKTSR